MSLSQANLTSINNNATYIIRSVARPMQCLILSSTNAVVGSNCIGNATVPTPDSWTFNPTRNESGSGPNQFTIQFLQNGLYMASAVTGTSSSEVGVVSSLDASSKALWQMVTSNVSYGFSIMTANSTVHGSTQAITLNSDGSTTLETYGGTDVNQDYILEDSRNVNI